MSKDNDFSNETDQLKFSVDRLQEALSYKARHVYADNKKIYQYSKFKDFFWVGKIILYQK